jgi:hypothetical protein
MEILEKIKENKIASFVIALALVLFILFLIFTFQKNKITKNPEVHQPTQTQLQEKEKTSTSNKIEEPSYATTSGQLMDITETTIKVLNFEKTKNSIDPKNTERSMDVLNINALTPVGKGAEGATASALHELKRGQTITVIYNIENNNAFGIIINGE